MTVRSVVRSIVRGVVESVVHNVPDSDVPANAITTDSGDPITLDDGTTYVTTDA